MVTPMLIMNSTPVTLKLAEEELLVKVPSISTAVPFSYYSMNCGISTAISSVLTVMLKNLLRSPVTSRVFPVSNPAANMVLNIHWVKYPWRDFPAALWLLKAAGAINGLNSGFSASKKVPLRSMEKTESVEIYGPAS